MSDIYAETVRKMSDYIVSRLDASSDSCRHVVQDAKPSKRFIIGTLANLVDRDGSKKSSVQENAITVKFKITRPRPLDVNVRYSIFEEVKPTLEEKATFQAKNAWDRLDYSENFIVSANNNRQKLSFNEDARGNNYNCFIEYGESTIDGDTQVSVCIHNDSVSKYPDRYLFNVSMRISVEESKLIPYHYDYSYEGLPKSFDANYRAINCSVSYKEGELTTTPCPRFEQYKTKLKNSEKDFAFVFEQLSSSSSLDYVCRYGDILNDYLIRYEQKTPPQRIIEEHKVALDNYRKICDRYSKGIDVLKNNPDALRAFRLMNETFRLSSKHNAWRIFQIVYVITTIPSIVNSDDRDVCDVIHIPTGGGKTEAYLGATLFAMFYARLSGLETGNVAIVKFPLRMLTVQQVERVANKVIVAEMIRKKENIIGDPFSAAFFVGNSEDYPGKTEEAIAQLKDPGGSSSGKIIKKCPICGGDICLQVMPENRIVHKCKKCGENHYLYYTDEEIYRYLPTIIISTVDKFSTVSWNRNIKGLFGGKLNRCKNGHGYYSVAEACLAEKGCKSKDAADMSKISAPQLIIQDELHLIRESFGTIDSHFESFCEELEYSLTGKKPKRIAMTATITGCSEQIRQLYYKNANVFPGPNPHSVITGDYSDNPFFENECDGEEPKLHRLIVGLRPNGRDNQFAVNLSIKYAREFVNELSSGKIEFDPEFEMTPVKYQGLSNKFCRMLTYHNKKADVYSTAHFMNPVIATSDNPEPVIKKMLTGDSRMEEIRESIDSIGDFERTDEKQMHITSATSIVSHGVDIENWNFMEFQGIPNNTAEYIQAMSRVGRTYAGLVFVWFYPTRVRDLSFYHNFNEYHSIIDHKVEPVSINRWTYLGFRETCTSIFVATVMNYLSAIRNTPIYNRDQFRKMFEDGENPDNKDVVIDFMRRVYKVDANDPGCDMINKQISSVVEERIKIVLESELDNRNRSFFPKILVNNGAPYTGMQRGMRGIQDSVKFRKDPSSKEFQQRVEH